MTKPKKAPKLTAKKLRKPAAKTTRRPRGARAQAAPRGSVSAVLRDGVDKLTERVSNLFASRPADVVAALTLDHEGLRNFLDLLKDTDAEMSERRRAYAQFAALLKSHSIAEENVVYKTAMALPGREMHIKIAEGFVEHHLADDLMARIEKTTDALEWSAHANVLSEIVEHHLREEERDLFPLVRKTSSAKTDQSMLTAFLALRKRTQEKVTDQNAGALEGQT
jgi:hemerythrin-like domain-containing protein